jgi:hydrogenase maturation protein HypF
MLLEGLAARHGPVDVASGGYRIADGLLDLLPLMLTLVDEGDPLRGAARFHATLVEALTAWCVDSAQRQGLGTIVFGGGCFMNEILTNGLRARLNAAGLAVAEPRQVPPNDGGISLGQAWVARAFAQNSSALLH